MRQQVNEAYKKQWSKFMYSFFEYLPTKYEADKDAWKVRKLIWDFKDGKRTKGVAELIAKQIRKQFGAHTGEVVFACIPASSEAANTMRYKEFSAEVCRLAGTVDAFPAITLEGERLAVHERKGAKVVESVQVINFDKAFFAGKKVLVFDDILTLGYSYARFACALENYGAEVLGGYFLGKTLMK